jgi:hypothetical protein
MGKVHVASSTVPSPWTALRVRWVPGYGFPTLSRTAFAMGAAGPPSDYSALLDCRLGRGVSSAFPHASSPPAVPSLAGSPRFTIEDASRMLEVACCRMPRPRFVASHLVPRVGQVYLCPLVHAAPVHAVGLPASLVQPGFSEVG